ncbi:PucR family transcriptional regulator [Ornithinimicrobium sufpigmenti]|uniref:PucR family transcriptional regulator n=1 Tax=Ornithinimicrobium sufpigmenti TaxID=2508882 RepID=UPI00103564F1|nr:MULTISPECIES: PucR family transcriptional regulator [unclassified Ornithinimicrobium]
MDRQLSPVLPPSPTSGITVSEVLRLPVMQGTAVLAGERGLERLVATVNVMEVPDLLPWVRPRELLLTTGYPLRTHEGHDLTDWIADLDDHGLAGVAIKLARYVDELPEAALREADRRGFPVLAIPFDLGFDEVITQVLTVVINRRADTLARAEQVLQDLVGVVIAGGDLDQVCQGVVRHLARTSLVTTMDGRVLASAGPVPERVADLPGFDPTGRFVVETEVPGVSAQFDGVHRLVARVTGARADLGRLILFRDDAFTDDDNHVVGQATTAAALAITKQQAVAAVEGKYRADFLRDALLGRAGDAERVAAHAGELGWDLRRPLAVLVAEAEEVPSDDPVLRTLPERFRAAWERVASTDDEAAAVAGFNQEVVVLLGVPADDDPTTITERVRQMAEQVHGRGGGGRRVFVTGISRTITDLAELPRAYSEARKAAQVGRRLHGDRAVTHFDALGVFRLLSQVEDRAELASFIGETLGPLAAVDSEEMEDLRTTLTVLLDHNLNVASTARALHFHYNSLRYRISKLERLLGPFTTDPRLRFAIMLALQARQLDHG